MTTNTNTAPSIRELTAQAFKDGCSQTKDACEYVRARIERFDHEELVNVIVQMLPTFIPVARSGMRHGSVMPVQPRRTQGVSRVQRYRDSWERKKEDQLFINGIIKRFGDCTREDLFQYADYLDEKADEIHQSADYYRTIADRLDAGQKVDSLESEAL